MVEMYQHQAMWNVYQHLPIHEVFKDLYATERIWVHSDRVNMQPPCHADYLERDHKAMYHWDAGTSVLYLTDTTDNQGSFVCWPGAHKSLIDPDQPWLPEIDPAQFVRIPGPVGSLLVWHRAQHL